MKSEEYRDRAMKRLENVANDVGDIYYSIRSELEKEILNRKETIDKTDAEIKSIYAMLSDEKCITLIKKKLPLRVKLFNKILWSGTAIKRSDMITVYFSFNDSNYNYFQYEFNAREIKELLKIK